MKIFSLNKKADQKSEFNDILFKAGPQKKIIMKAANQSAQDQRKLVEEYRKMLNGTECAH